MSARRNFLGGGNPKKTPTRTKKAHPRRKNNKKKKVYYPSVPVCPHGEKTLKNTHNR